MKVGLVIQARMGSERLPGKILYTLPYQSHETILNQVVARSCSVNPKYITAIATSTNIKDDVIANLYSNKVFVYRGDETDVLARYYQSALELAVDHVVRLTADNPFIDPQWISSTINSHLLSGAEYSYTVGLPLGTNMEIIQFKALEKSFLLSKSADEREHVTIFIKKNPELFRINKIDIVSFKSNNYRLTIDTLPDYTLACLLYENLYNKHPFFGLDDIVDFFNKNPWAVWINKEVNQKKIYSNNTEEIEDAIRLLKQHHMNYAAKFLEHEG